MKPAILGGIVFLLLLVAQAQAETRLALVIGNSQYTSSPKLKNPVADARLIEGKLRDLGFEVTALVDLPHIPMRRALLEFTEKVAAGGDDTTALIYYSGHGVQVRDQNYLIPVDAKLERELDAEIEGLPLSGVISYLEAAQARRTIIIVDACRDNPLRSSAKSIAKKGLARVTVPRGLYIGFAAGPGSTALDGTGENSPFAASLARHITTPGISVDQIFSRIRADVDAETNGQQIPRAESALIGEFFFRQDDGASNLASTPPSVDAKPPEALCAGGEDPSVALQRAKEVGTFEAYTTLLRLCPGHPQKTKIEEARERAAETAVWRLATQQDTREAYERYLIYYPSGEYSSTARDSVARLDLRAESLAWAEAQTSNTEMPLRDYLARFPRGTHRGEAEERLTALASGVAVSNQLPAPTPSPIITTFVGYDLYGGDLQSVPAPTSESCNAQCGSNPSCSGYTYNETFKVCIVKGRWERAYRFEGAVSGIVEARAAGMPRPDISSAGFALLRDVDLMGGDYDNVKGLTLDACREMCDGESACRAFSYVPRLRWCWLKSGEGQRRPKAKIVSGIKQ